MLRRHLSSITLSFAAAVLAAASPTFGEENTKAPCETIARHLREVAERQPDPVVDTGQWELLTAAALKRPLKRSEHDSGGPVSTIPVQRFDTVDAALESISELTLGTARQRLLDELGFMDDTPTYIRDFRPTSDHLIISQSQGTMNCDTGVMYRIASGQLEPIATIAGDPGEMCWSEHMTAFRIGASAYAAVENITNEPGMLSYSLALMPPEPAAISAQVAACTVNIRFTPQAYLEAASPATGVAAQWVTDLLAKIGPLVTDGQDLGAALRPMIPAPSGDTAYDDFLRAGNDGEPYYLRNLDEDGVLDELPESETHNQGSTSGMTAYALAFEGHRLVLLFGQPNYGWKVSPDNSFGIWEWTGEHLVPIASGDLAKRASHPTITVQ
jgi:hypothetical protein